MCGICGVVGNYVFAKEIDAFKDLLTISVLRGPHSTGVFNVTREFKKVNEYEMDFRYLKSDINSIDFLEQFGDNQVFTEVGKKALIGHTRSATIGSITIDNAHPFSFGNLVGVHNGTIRKDFTYSKDHETDSEALYHLISEAGLKEALQEVNGFSSAYALAMFDSDKEELKLVRNDERPLFICYDDKKELMFFASEIYFIKMAAARRGIKLDPEGIKYLRPGIVYHYPLNNTRFHEHAYTEDLKLEKPKSIVQGYVYKHDDEYRDWWHGQRGKWIDASDGSKKFVPVDSLHPDIFEDCSIERKEVKDNNLLPFIHQKNKADDNLEKKKDDVNEKSKEEEYDIAFYSGGNGALLTKEEMRKVIELKGCCWCSETYELKDWPSLKNRLMFVTRDDFLCESCQVQDEIKQYIS